MHWNLDHELRTLDVVQVWSMSSQWKRTFASFAWVMKLFGHRSFGRIRLCFVIRRLYIRTLTLRACGVLYSISLCRFSDTLSLPACPLAVNLAVLQVSERSWSSDTPHNSRWFRWRSLSVLALMLVFFLRRCYGPRTLSCAATNVAFSWFQARRICRLWTLRYDWGRKWDDHPYAKCSHPRMLSTLGPVGLGIVYTSIPSPAWDMIGHRVPASQPPRETCPRVPERTELVSPTPTTKLAASH